MSILATIALAVTAAIPSTQDSVIEKMEPKVLQARDNGLVVEMVIACRGNNFGVMHFDKITKTYIDPKNTVHLSAASAYVSTCGLADRITASK